MPELPEVETIKRDLSTIILNKHIKNIEVLNLKSFINNSNLLIQGKINNIERIGKFIIIHIKPNIKLVIHLRMTGKLIYHKNIEFDRKHVRVIFYFDSNDCLIFHDVRKFGRIICTDGILTLNNNNDALLITAEYLKNILHNKKQPIKTLLLDQSIISGIGNIYAQEILFAAKISPLRIAKSLTEKEILVLHEKINEILPLAILHNGTSISDFRRVDDKTGDFQNFLKVYGKSTCPDCKSDLIKIKQGGRTTRYCEKCTPPVPTASRR